MVKKRGESLITAGWLEKMGNEAGWKHLEGKEGKQVVYIYERKGDSGMGRWAKR